MTLAVLARCSTLSQAQVMRSALQSAGLQVSVLDEMRGSNVWTEQVFLGGFRVVVPVQELDDALLILREVVEPSPPVVREKLRWSFWPLLIGSFFFEGLLWGWVSARTVPRAWKLVMFVIYACAVALVVETFIASRLGAFNQPY
jgi:hypothetical protein